MKMQFTILMTLATFALPALGLSRESKFADFLRTDPRTGAPLLFRNGKWVSVEARLSELMSLLKETAFKTNLNSYAGTEKALNAIKNADIPPGVFGGANFAQNLSDTNLKRVMSMEWVLGFARESEFDLNVRHSWQKTATEMYLEFSTPPRLSAPVVAHGRWARVKGAVKNMRSATVLKVGVPTIVVGTAAYLLLSRKASPSENIGSEQNNDPVGAQDDAFGAAQ